MFQTAIPVFHVKSSRAADNFYCRHLGFQKEFEYRIDEAKADPCYMGLRREKAWIHLSSFSGDGVAGGVVFLLVDDVDVLFREFTTNKRCHRPASHQSDLGQPRDVFKGR